MWIIVPNDKETWSSLDGCLLAEVPDSASAEEIEESLLGLRRHGGESPSFRILLDSTSLDEMIRGD